MDEKINLVVRYFLNDTVYVDRLNPDPVNARTRGLTVGPLERRGEKGRHKGLWEKGRRREERENHFADYLEGLWGF